MIVLDASAVVELLLNTEAGQTVGARIADAAIALHVPHLLDVEVAQALRRYAGKPGSIAAAAAEDALMNLGKLDLRRHAHGALLGRVWELRHQVSAYDAVYVALAQALGATLLTCDGKLAAAPNLGIRVDLVAV